MSSIYEIQRWDVIYNNTKSNLKTGPTTPVVYVTATDDLLSYIHKMNYEIPVKITDTNSPYDNKLTMARVNLAENTAGYRPNFQAITNLIVFELDVVWVGYPVSVGNVHVLDNEVAPEVIPDVISEFGSDVVSDVVSDVSEYFQHDRKKLVVPCSIMVLGFVIALLLVKCDLDT